MRTIVARNIKLVIIADDKNFTAAVWESLRAMNIFELVGDARNIQSALKLLTENETDVFLIDTPLAGADIHHFNDELASVFNRGACVAFFPVGAHEDDYESIKNCVDRIIKKPFDLSTLSRGIVEAYNARNADIPPLAVEVSIHAENDVNEFIFNTLNDAGIRSGLKGYAYLHTAISMSIRDSGLADSITKLLYPVVAKKHTTTPANVERAIRHAIEDAGPNRCAKVLTSNAHKEQKMTNGRFIRLAVEQYSRGVMR